MTLAASGAGTPSQLGEIEMAQTVTVALEDDLDGGPAEQTMRFMFGGRLGGGGSAQSGRRGRRALPARLVRGATLGVAFEVLQSLAR
jgi:hypothetical protein